MSVFNYLAFNGGYFTNITDSLLKDNELTIAENCYWDNVLVKRKGIIKNASITGFTALYGVSRHRTSSATWRTFIVGVGGASASCQLFEVTSDNVLTTVQGLYNAVGGVTTTSYTFSTGHDVSFVRWQDDKAVGVNGKDDPFIIRNYASQTCFIQTLDSYDERTRDNDYWYAGQVLSLTEGSVSNDTTAAQDDTADDFDLVVNGDANSGFFIGCDETFNKSFLYSVDAAGTVSLYNAYEYYGYPNAETSATWVTATLIQEPTWSIAGNKTIEFDLPFDPNTGEFLMAKMDNDDYIDTVLYGRYSLRAYTTAAPGAVTADYIDVRNSQYVTQLLLNDKPDVIAQHKGHIFLGAGNWMIFSPLNSLKNWRSNAYEAFTDGGRIKAMVSHLDYLAIILDGAIYGIGGNSFSNFVIKYLTNKGAYAGKTAAVVNDYLYFLAEDGLYQWDGQNIIKVSKHISSDIESYLATNARALSFKGEYYLLFPDSDRMLKFDPDTFRTDELGDGRVSFYKFTYAYGKFIEYQDAADDSGNLYIWESSATAAQQFKYFTGYVDSLVDGSAAGNIQAIEFKFGTKYFDFGQPFIEKTIHRIKPGVAIDATDSMTMYMEAKNKYGVSTANSVSMVIDLATNAQFYNDEFAVPPGYDANFMRLIFQATSTVSSKITFFGIGVDAERRKF